MGAGGKGKEYMMTDQTERNFSTLGYSLEMSCSKKKTKTQNIRNINYSTHLAHL